MVDEQVAQVWSTKEIIGAVIATGLLSAAAREIIDWIKNFRRSRREATYIAIRVSLALEEFAQSCAAMVDAIGAEHETFGDIYTTALPDPPRYPQDVDWRSIGADDSDKLLTFINVVEVHRREADYARNFEGDSWHVEGLARNLGRTALTLSKDIRRRHGLKIHTYLDEHFPEEQAAAPAHAAQQDHLPDARAEASRSMSTSDHL